MTILMEILVNDERDKEVSMSKKYGCDRQLLLPFEYKQKVDELIKTYKDAGDNINDLAQYGPEPAACGEEEAELCNEVAAAVKMDLRESGMSREQLVDAMNAFFGRTEDGANAEPPTCKKPLTINMLNSYLSKPAEYPIPCHFQYAFNRIFGSFRVQRTIVKAMGGKVISGEDVRRLAFMQISEVENQARVLKKMI
jgi:hypothetical protein